MAEPRLHANHAAREHAAQAVRAEAGAERGLDLVLQDQTRLVAAQVAHGCGWTRPEMQSVEVISSYNSPDLLSGKGHAVL